MFVEADKLGLGRRFGLLAECGWGLIRNRHAPFIGVQRHGLGKVQRAKARIDRNGDDRLAKGDVGGLQARPLAAEQEAGGQALADRGVQLARRLARGQDRQARLARARGGRIEPLQVADRVLQPVENAGIVQRPVGAGGAGPGPGLGPAVAGAHQAQVRQAEVGHHPRHGADVLRQLRLVQDHARRLAHRLAIAGFARPRDRL